MVGLYFEMVSRVDGMTPMGDILAMSHGPESRVLPVPLMVTVTTPLNLTEINALGCKWNTLQ